MTHLADDMLSTDAMTAVFAPEATLASMLAFEAALARAQAKAGIVPAEAAGAIARACRADAFDPADIAGRARRAGTLAMPVVAELAALVGQADSAAAAWVHFGATSQDMVDTGLVLQLRSAVALLDADLLRVEAALARHARDHAATVMTGRTLMQAASPVTFGLKAAGWYAAARAGRRRLDAAAREALVLQFGGASGTLAALGDKGPAVAEALARELDLPLPAAPWHSRRDAIAALAAAASIVAGSLGKMARDISLLMQPEVGEAFEPAGQGRGGSSAMPHKRNPVGCMAALSAAERAPGLLSTILSGMVQEHERGLGGWQAEWPTLPALFEAAGGTAAAMAEVTEGLEVDATTMRTNLEARRGLVFTEALAAALTERMGREKARALVETAARQTVDTERHLADVCRTTPEISEALGEHALARIFDTDAVAATAETLIGRLLNDEN